MVPVHRRQEKIKGKVLHGVLQGRGPRNEWTYLTCMGAPRRSNYKGEAAAAFVTREVGTNREASDEEEEGVCGRGGSHAPLARSAAAPTNERYPGTLKTQANQANHPRYRFERRTTSATTAFRAAPTKRRPPCSSMQHQAGVQRRSMWSSTRA